MCINSSNSPEESSPKSRDCFFNGVVTISIIIILLLVGCCAFTFYHTIIYHTSHIDCDHEWMALRDSIYADVIHIDSIFNAHPVESINTKKNGKKYSRTELDSLKTRFFISYKDVELIKNAQKVLIIRQDKLADDLRQESNNLINKVNGWLGFWIGIMALLGVFIPIALQFKLYRESRDTDQKIEKDVEKIIQKFKRDFDKLRFKTIAEITRLDNHKTEIEKSLSAKMDEFNHVKSMAIARSFQSIAECPEINVNNNRDNLLKDNWKEMIDIFGKYVDDYCKKDSNFASPYSLSLILLQIISTLSIIRTLNPRRSRQVKKLKDLAYELVKEFNESGIDKSKKENSLRNFNADLQNFNPFPI